VLDVSLAGDDAPVPVLARGWVRELREEPDPRRRLQIVARNGRMILERVTPIYEVLGEAAAAEPEIASLSARHKAQRFAGQAELARLPPARGRPRLVPPPVRALVRGHADPPAAPVASRPRRSPTSCGAGTRRARGHGALGHRALSRGGCC